MSDLDTRRHVVGTPGGESVRTATLVQFNTHDGTVGYGEAFALPRTVATDIKELSAGNVVGIDPTAAGSFVGRVYAGNIAGYHFARGPIFLNKSLRR